MPDSALTPDLQGRTHWDWPWPFSLIPRGWTAWKWGRPTLLAGRAEIVDAGCYVHPKPINPAGTWQVSYFPGAPWWAKPAIFVGFTLRSGRNFRAGPRWDDVGNYVQWPAYGTRHYTGAAIQDTSTR